MLELYVCILPTLSVDRLLGLSDQRSTRERTKAPITEAYERGRREKYTSERGGTYSPTLTLHVIVAESSNSTSRREVLAHEIQAEPFKTVMHFANECCFSSLLIGFSRFTTISDMKRLRYVGKCRTFQQ